MNVSFPSETKLKMHLLLSKPINGLQRLKPVDGLGCGKYWDMMVRRDKFSRMGQTNLKTPSHITKIAP